jgi:hypothetical protein
MLLLIIFSNDVNAQSTQSWVDFNLHVPLPKHILLNNQFAYRTNDSKVNKWRSFAITSIAQMPINSHLDVQGGLLISQIQQKESYNTTELRFEVGARYHFTPQKRIQLRSFLRLEQRNLYHQETSSWGSSIRTRLRLECMVPINGKTMLKNDLWYGLTDAEFFWPMDRELKETFANQRRFRLGLGYRYTNNWRFEFIYSNLYTRNIIDAGFIESSNVLRLRVRYYIIK